MQIVKVFTSHPHILWGKSHNWWGSSFLHASRRPFLNLEVIGSNPISANAEQLS